jgi:hypothetical protein
MHGIWGLMLSFYSRCQLLANAAMAGSRMAAFQGLPDPGPFGSRDWLLTAPVRFDGLDVVHAAAIPLRADPTAIRCGEMVEQVRTMSGD